ncbi:hypothetical protein BGAL_0561g00020 [Botrytis galanthina]|uniref:Uncharacterized protein n=1 Tax=Botrytis galanthina TaxID=278940 RepID=A0A4V4HTC4_9HELO|nr:hypothetical protein BGAL_0561g00020 [Botrytis galanthina]
MANPNDERMFPAFDETMRPGARVQEKIQRMDEYVKKLDLFLTQCKKELGRRTLSKQKWDSYQATLSKYENTSIQMTHAEENMEAALNELETRQNNDRQVADQDEASAARIESILARERKDAATIVGEAYVLILLNDKSLDHIRSLSPSTKRLLNNAELLPLREQIRDLREQLKNSVQVPATLPDVGEVLALQDKLAKEQARSKALNEKIHQLYAENFNLTRDVAVQKADAQDKLNCWNESKAEVSKLKKYLKQANILLQSQQNQYEALRKTHKKSCGDYDKEIKSLKDDRDHVHEVHNFREKFFCSCIALTLEIPNEIKNTWHDVFRSLPQDFTSDLTLEPKNLSHHQLWIVKTPVISGNDGEISKSPKDDMASPMSLAFELYHQLHSRSSKIEEPRTLELMSLVITTTSSIEGLSLGQVIISCCRAFYTYGWVPNEEDNRPSFLHGIASLSMMIMTHQMVMRYPKIEGRYLIEDYVQDGINVIDPSHQILCKLCTIIPGITTASMEKVVDSLKVHFDQKVIHYPLGSTHIIEAVDDSTTWIIDDFGESASSFTDFFEDSATSLIDVFEDSTTPWIDVFDNSATSEIILVVGRFLNLSLLI